METKGGDQNSNWRLDLKDFRLPDRSSSDHKSSFCFQSILRRQRKQKRVADYYKRQETLTEGFREMEVMNESSYIPGKLTEDEMKQLARSERIAINVSNVANFLLFISKVVASAESKSLAVIASTLDNFLDLLFGFILWFTAHAMKTPNQYKYPIGKKRMQPVGIIVFASITATLGLEVVLESGKDLINKDGPDMSHQEEKWMIGIMVFATVVKFMLMIYCGRFKNEIVRAYALDHFFEVISGSVGLATAVIANRYYWWTDSVGAILIALFTMHTWAKTVVENVHLLIGNTAPPDFLKKLTFLVWNHNEEIKHIKTVRAYTSGSYYFAEIEIVLPCNMILSKAHNIGETLKVKLEQLPEIERAFVNTDFELTLAPQHNTDV